MKHMTDIKRAQKRIAKILSQTLMVRDYPIESDRINEKTPSHRMYEYGHTGGFNHGLALALAILVSEEK